VPGCRHHRTSHVDPPRRLAVVARPCLGRDAEIRRDLSPFVHIDRRGVNCPWGQVGDTGAGHEQLDVTIPRHRCRPHDFAAEVDRRRVLQGNANRGEREQSAPPHPDEAASEIDETLRAPHGRPPDHLSEVVDARGVALLGIQSTKTSGPCQGSGGRAEPVLCAQGTRAGERQDDDEHR
jgi:hypothetical protein